MGLGRRDAVPADGLSTAQLSSQPLTLDSKAVPYRVRLHENTMYAYARYGPQAHQPRHNQRGPRVPYPSTYPPVKHANYGGAIAPHPTPPHIHVHVLSLQRSIPRIPAEFGALERPRTSRHSSQSVKVGCVILGAAEHLLPDRGGEKLRHCVEGRAEQRPRRRASLQRDDCALQAPSHGPMVVSLLLL